MLNIRQLVVTSNTDTLIACEFSFSESYQTMLIARDLYIYNDEFNRMQRTNLHYSHMRYKVKYDILFVVFVLVLVVLKRQLILGRFWTLLRLFLWVAPLSFFHFICAFRFKNHTLTQVRWFFVFLWKNGKRKKQLQNGIDWKPGFSSNLCNWILEIEIN